jgi:hypothetical protein
MSDLPGYTAYWTRKAVFVPLEASQRFTFFLLIVYLLRQKVNRSRYWVTLEVIY